MGLKAVIGTVAFLTGAVVMSLEIVGARVLAPQFGMNMIVWTIVIGTVLTSLSIGYWWGGRLADSDSVLKKLLLLLVGAVFSISLTGILPFPLPPYFSSPYLLSFIVFSPSSIFLGACFPCLVRLRLSSLSHAGFTVGKLNALSTLGSISGTFITGLWLIPSIGTRTVLLTLALLLVFCSVLVWMASAKAVSKVPILFLVFPISTFFLGSGQRPFVKEFNTLYARYLLIDTYDSQSQRPLRILKSELRSVQAANFLDGARESALPHFPIYRKASAFASHFHHALVLGGGAQTWTQELVRLYPTLQVDSVEIDPQLYDIAKDYFDFKPDSRIHVAHEDARTFINHGPLQKYDLIFFDLFHGSVIPFYMLSLESLEKTGKMMSQGGILVMNVIAKGSGVFLQRLVATVNRVFPYYFLVPVNPGFAIDDIQNFVLVASSQKLEENRFPERLSNNSIAAANLIFTDDFAPVEYLSARENP